MWFVDVWLFLFFDEEVFDVLSSVTFAFDLLNTAYTQKTESLWLSERPEREGRVMLYLQTVAPSITVSCTFPKLPLPRLVVGVLLTVGLAFSLPYLFHLSS